MTGRLALVAVITGTLCHVGAWRDDSTLPDVPLPRLFTAPPLILPVVDLTLYQMSVMEGW